MRVRDYKAEYARRIARAAAKGYSKAVARGHAPKGVIGIARAKKLKVPPGFVIAGRHGKGFKASKKSRRDNLRNIGIAPSDFRISDVVTDQDTFVQYLTEAGFTEREAFTLWFS